MFLAFRGSAADRTQRSHDLLLDIRINQEVLAKRTLWPAEGGIHHVRGYRASGANYKRSGFIPEYVEFVLTRRRGKECPI